MRAQLSDERCAAKRQIEVLAPARAPQKLDSFGQQHFFPLSIFNPLSFLPFFLCPFLCVVLSRKKTDAKALVMFPQELSQ